jgi:hypothetical protein
MSSDEPAEETDLARSQSRTRLLHRLALVQAVILLAAVVFALPLAFQSMGIQLTDGQARTLYDFPSGQPSSAEDAPALADTESFINMAAIDLDEANNSITLAISGHRNCEAECAPLKMTLFSLDDNANVRRALPPSAPLSLDPTQPFFSQTVQLPIRGQPNQFPFDDYMLWLGLSGTITVDGKDVPLTTELLDGHAVFTSQNQLRDFTMKPPVEIDPARVHAITDPFDFVGVQELRFERPNHQEILAVLLVTLITVSAIMAVSVRDVSDLIVGIGSLVLGIWGVRSVLVPSSLGVATSVDLALSLVILLVLLGLSLRVAQHYQKTSDLPSLPVRRVRARVKGGKREEGEKGG